MSASKLSVSNIGWNLATDSEAAHFLNREGIRFVDIAPSKYFDDYANVSTRDASNLEKWWRNRGISIVGFQSLLFKQNHLNLFGTSEIQESLLSHLEGVGRLAATLGVRSLVFGSPLNRRFKEEDRGQAQEIAIEFLSKLDALAEKIGVVYCLEPNPAIYGGNFMLSSLDTSEIVKSVGGKNIQMQFDLGACEVNLEDPEVIASKYASQIGHVHLSSTNLRPLYETSFTANKIKATLLALRGKEYFTIEQLPFGADSNAELNALRNSIHFVTGACDGGIIL